MELEEGECEHLDVITDKFTDIEQVQEAINVSNNYPKEGHVFGGRRLFRERRLFRGRSLIG